MFQTRCKYFKHVANIQNTLLMWGFMFQTRCEYSKHVVNVSTALYSQRVANSRKKIIQGKYTCISHRNCGSLQL